MDQLALKGISHPLDHELTEGLVSLGRNPTNDIRISDLTVSSFHCELVVTQPGGVVVRDLSSTNGTFVNDQPVHEAILRPGQELRLGNARLRLELRPTAEVPVVAIPQMPATAPAPVQTHLLDGTLACLNHPGTPAIAACTKCEKAFCIECVRSVGLAGRQTRLFCPTCNAPCRSIVPVPARQRSFLGRLTQTIRIHLTGVKE